MFVPEKVTGVHIWLPAAQAAQLDDREQPQDTHEAGHSVDPAELDCLPLEVQLRILAHTPSCCHTRKLAWHHTQPKLDPLDNVAGRYVRLAEGAGWHIVALASDLM